MDAMVMPFAVQPGIALDSLAPGDRVRFRLRVGHHASAIDRLTVVSAPRTDIGLERTPVAPVLVAIGEPMPDFTLTDHRGHTVSLSALRGRVVLVTFIYTRCPLPDYCPRLIEHGRAVRARFPDRLGRDLVLLTITFDPKYDTVETLRAYASHMRADVEGWHFLTGDEASIARVTEAFGVEVWPEEGLLTHTLQASIVDREGRLAATVEGRDYRARQLGDLVASVLDR
jgi:protein SCO1/2